MIIGNFIFIEKELLLLTLNATTDIISWRTTQQNKYQPFQVKKTELANIKNETAQKWYQILAHASNEAIQLLETSAKGVKISSEEVPKTNECEPYALSKAHRIVSRSSKNAESSKEPFYSITYDFMLLNTAMNKDEWVSHFACHATDFNMVFTHAHKSDAARIVKEAVNIIETRFKSMVVFIRPDGECSLGNEFKDLLIEKDITYESSTPDTPEQNGHSERKGGILAMKARAMRIDAGLPIYLWPEIVRTAGYIANRTPMRKHQWKTPYELVIGNPPDLSHLRRYGCRAYTLNKQISKKQKLQERAHIGHLVGYEARNIFRVWIPSQRKIIRTRDVMFDESISYDAHDIDLLQAINEPMLETTYELHDLDPITQITEIASDEGEGEGDHTQNMGENVESMESQDGNVQELVSSHMKERTYLPTPTTSESFTKSTKAKKAAKPKASKDINSSLDTNNILPEGVGRLRIPNQRKVTYATVLADANNGELNSYHAAFSAHIMASSYYITNKESSKESSKNNTLVLSTRFHRDSLPPEPEHYRQMLKHPHAEGFMLAMKVEVQALIAKNTWTEVGHERSSCYCWQNTDTNEMGIQINSMKKVI